MGLNTTNNSNQQTIGLYTYQSSTVGDAVNDTRFYTNTGIIYFEKCTVLNATKGAGTWVQTISLDSTNINIAGTVNNIKCYEAIINQTLSNEVNSGSLTISKNYLIKTNTTGDFTNTGALDNNPGTQFIATGITPTSWGDGVLVDTPEPTAIIWNNSLGENLTYTFDSSTQYSIIGSINLFLNAKTFILANSPSYDINVINAGEVNNNILYIQNPNESSLATSPLYLSIKIKP